MLAWHLIRSEEITVTYGGATQPKLDVIDTVNRDLITSREWEDNTYYINQLP